MDCGEGGTVNAFSGVSLAPETRKYLEELGVDLGESLPLARSRGIEPALAAMKRSRVAGSNRKTCGSKSIVLGHKITPLETIGDLVWDYRPYLKFIGWTLLLVIGIPVAGFVLYLVVCILIRLLLMAIGFVLFVLLLGALGN